jgi:hypothetical protein
MCCPVKAIRAGTSGVERIVIVRREKGTVCCRLTRRGAKALNDGDVARSQIATVLLGILDPPLQSKNAPSRQRMIKLAAKFGVRVKSLDVDSGIYPPFFALERDVGHGGLVRTQTANLMSARCAPSPPPTA